MKKQKAFFADLRLRVCVEAIESPIEVVLLLNNTYIYNI